MKKVGGFLSHEGGGQRRFDICHKKVVIFFEGFPKCICCLVDSSEKVSR